MKYNNTARKIRGGERERGEESEKERDIVCTASKRVA